MRREVERLRDILDAIAAIERYANRGKEAFEEDELIRVWIVYHLQVIGEAVNALPDGSLARYPDIPWRNIIDFRNLVVHEYFRVSLNIVWEIVVKELKPLKQTVETMLIDLEQ
jgi:uncharacterized protein with HEPN domain